ncbi:MAG TPA: hypothetical protein VGD40_15985 [Chryseosolibacter sp.]
MKKRAWILGTALLALTVLPTIVSPLTQDSRLATYVLRWNEKPTSIKQQTAKRQESITVCSSKDKKQSVQR